VKLRTYRQCLSLSLDRPCVCLSSYTQPKVSFLNSHSSFAMLLKAVSFLDIAVFILFLSFYLIRDCDLLKTINCGFQALPFLCEHAFLQGCEARATHSRSNFVSSHQSSRPAHQGAMPHIDQTSTVLHTTHHHLPGCDDKVHSVGIHQFAK
jgi:hypothetical protein